MVIFYLKAAAPRAVPFKFVLRVYSSVNLFTNSATNSYLRRIREYVTGLIQVPIQAVKYSYLVVSGKSIVYEYTSNTTPPRTLVRTVSCIFHIGCGTSFISVCSVTYGFSVASLVLLKLFQMWMTCSSRYVRPQTSILMHWYLNYIFNKLNIKISFPMLTLYIFRSDRICLIIIK